MLKMADCKRKASALLFFFILLLTNSCGEKIGDVVRIVVTPLEANVGVGGTVHFSAKGYDSDNTPISISPSWSVVEDIGTINASGLFQASKTGQGYVIAQYAGFSDQSVVNVTDAGGISGRVSNSNGERLQGILMTLVNGSSSMTTDSDGVYSFSDLGAGTYSICAHENVNYLIQTKEATVTVGNTTTLNFTMVSRIIVQNENISHSGVSVTVNGTLVNNGGSTATDCTVSYVFYNADGLTIGSGSASAGDLSAGESKIFSVQITLSEEDYSIYRKTTSCGGY